MDAIKCITNRRSIRNFTDKDISDDILKEIVNISRFYPSWKNSQTVRFVAVKGDLKNKIASKATSFDQNKRIISTCNTLMVLLTINGRSGYERDGIPSTSKGSHFQSFDAGLAAEAFVLSAYEKGVGSVILGLYDENIVKEELNISDDMSVSCLIALGYPTEEVSAPKRKEVDEILTIM